jgi:hypothetical protein
MSTRNLATKFDSNATLWVLYVFRTMSSKIRSKIAPRAVVCRIGLRVFENALQFILTV